MTIRQQTRAFARTNNALGSFHLGVSLALYLAALWLGITFFGNWLVVAFAIFLFTGASVRLFGVQHDNGHLSYFTNRRANVWTGVILGAFTNNAFHSMRYNHNRHHAYVGNLDQMEDHEVWTMTVREYQAAPLRTRVTYRIYRSAPVIFFLGPIFIFFIRYRFPRNCLKVGWWDAAMQNALMAAFWAAVYFAAGWTGLKFLIMAEVVAAMFGTLMVYCGHNHEETYWQRDAHVDFEDASLQGASVLDLGPVFDFMTFNFAYHDLHHLNSKVPCYYLKQCHVALSDQLNPSRLGLWEALTSIQWKLWDEDRGRMIRFRDLKQPMTAMQPAE